jgi:hypothetical protein
MPAGSSVSAPCPSEPEERQELGAERVRLGSASGASGGEGTGGQTSEADSAEKNSLGSYSMVWDRSSIDEQCQKHAQQVRCLVFCISSTRA